MRIDNHVHFRSATGACFLDFRILFSIKHFTLVNIIADKEVIKELLANDFTADKVAEELQRLLTDEAYKKEMLANYKHLSDLLGTQPASATAASIITSKQ